jgi:four helix bundle protein
MKVQNFKELKVWQDSFALARDIYAQMERFPKNELFGLCSQMQRAAVSIPSNIAEGSGRKGTKEFVQFLYIALGSCAELETQVMLAESLGFIDPDVGIGGRINEVQRMLHGLIRSLKAR